LRVNRVVVSAEVGGFAREDMDVDVRNRLTCCWTISVMANEREEREMGGQKELNADRGLAPRRFDKRIRT